MTETERVVPAEIVENLRDVARAAKEQLLEQAKEYAREEELLDRILAAAVEVVDLSGEDEAGILEALGAKPAEADVSEAYEVVDRRTEKPAGSTERADPEPADREPAGEPDRPATPPAFDPGPVPVGEPEPPRVRARPEALRDRIWERLTDYQRGVLEKGYRNGGKAEAAGKGRAALLDRDLIEYDPDRGGGNACRLTDFGRRVCEAVFGDPDGEAAIALLRRIAENGPAPASKLDPRALAWARDGYYVEDRAGKVYLTERGAALLSKRDYEKRIAKESEECPALNPRKENR